MNKKDIAIVGMACKFFDSDGTQAFWENLRAGKELIHFYSPEELQALQATEAEIHDPAYVKARSFVRDKDAFDFAFFGYTRDEAEAMDPQIRLFHEYAWKALEDAGCDPFAFPGKIGVFAGASNHVNWTAHRLLTGIEGQTTVDPFYGQLIANKQFLSTLISYKLNLRGPSYFIDTACSTSLSAVHLACRNLLMNECSVALAGAVRIDTSKAVGYQYEPGMIYSRDGHCKPFDGAASGTISGEGVGIVVLNRLEDAVQNRDQIYAVIRSSAVNNDGNRKVGYTAPSYPGQAECIQLAHKLASVDPGSVSYL
ncbi:MAG TPA: polyketide synthase, partial [Cytophagales bacterium]